MRDVMTTIGAILLVIIIMLGLGWLFMGNEFFMYKFFAPKTEQVRRTVFEESKAYRQGTIQELQNMQIDYIKADKDGKAAMATIILHRAADVPPDTLPVALNMFISELKASRGMQ